MFPSGENQVASYEIESYELLSVARASIFKTVNVEGLVIATKVIK